MSQHSSRGRAWGKLRLLCIERDGWTCQHCGQALAGDNATADHVISKAQWAREQRPGNPDNLDNLIALCRSCNSSKQDNPNPGRITWHNPAWFPTG